MFSDEVLEKIFARKELQSLDLSTQSIEVQNSNLIAVREA